jgi:hypothetical protein
MPKHHNDSARGQASHGRNDLPYVILSSTGIKVVNSPSNIYVQEVSHPLKGVTAYCSDKTRQRLADKPYPLAWQL